MLSAIPQLFEQLVCESFEMTLGELVHPNQHGFRSGQSTTTNLVRYINQVLQQMSSCGQVDAVYTDFSKAFTKVNHQLLIRKLELLGVGGPILNWLESYLSGRSQQV